MCYRHPFAAPCSAVAAAEIERVGTTVAPRRQLHHSVLLSIAMAYVDIKNVVVLNNPAPFLAPLSFEITFDFTGPLNDGAYSPLACA